MNQHNKKRRICGVVAAQAADIEQRQILQGVIEQAQSADMDVAVFSNIYNPEKPNSALLCENSIYDLILSPELDGIILISEVILNKALQQSIKEKLISQRHIPIVVIGTEISDFALPNFTFINTSDENDIEAITDHLIEVHGFTDIDIITGHKELNASHSRVRGYRKSLKKHGIPFNRNKVYFGDFWMNSGQALAQRYIKSELPFPEAILCANDYMAYGLLDDFLAHDVHVPEDVTVVGYEYIRERLYHSPILTTYQRNRKGVGAEAVRILQQKINGGSYEINTGFAGEIICGNSCDCGIKGEQFNQELTSVRKEQIYSLLNLFSQFEQRLTECRSMRDYITVCQEFCYLIRDVYGIYLCLYENWCTSGDDTGMMNCYRVMGPDSLSDVQVFFNQYEMSVLFSHFTKPAAYYFNPLFFSDRVLGYIVLLYDSPDTYDHIFRNWVKAASNALEFLRMKNDISYLLQCQNLSVYQDSVTGLYNRKGFEYAVTSIISTLESEQKFMLLLLKTDLFSAKSQFSKQDKKMKLSLEIADAVKRLMHWDNDICGRINDNVYAFACFSGADEDYSELLVDKLKTILIHKPLYMSERGMHTFVCSAGLYSTAEFDLDSAFQGISAALNEKTKEIAENLALPQYSNLQELRNTIYSNPLVNHPAEEICQTLCFSIGHFRNLYKKYFGISYHQDCIYSKISTAKYLLCTTSMSITAIAAKCGYEDEKYFMRLFQKFTSRTPNQYRALFQFSI